MTWMSFLNCRNGHRTPLSFPHAKTGMRTLHSDPGHHGQRVRLFTRNGHDWSGRFPLITEAALRHRCSSFVVDGEAVLIGVDGISDFNGLHSRKQDDEVQFYAFDILVDNGEDLRKLPLHLRKNNLARLLTRPVDGIFLSDFEKGEIGPDLFRHACLMGLEGLVSKHRDRPYRSGRSPHWIKVKNRTHTRLIVRRRLSDDCHG